MSVYSPLSNIFFFIHLLCLKISSRTGRVIDGGHESDDFSPDEVEDGEKPPRTIIGTKITGTPKGPCPRPKGCKVPGKPPRGTIWPLQLESDPPNGGKSATKSHKKVKSSPSGKEVPFLVCLVLPAPGMTSIAFRQKEDARKKKAKAKAEKEDAANLKKEVMFLVCLVLPVVVMTCIAFRQKLSIRKSS